MRSKFLIYFLASAIVQFLGGKVQGQSCNTVKVSGDSFTVTIKITSLETIVINSYCPNGFVYKTKIGYDVTFTGTNPALYTLQGYMSCAGTESFFDLPNNGGSGFAMASNASFGNCSFFPPTPEDFPCDKVRLFIEGRGITGGSQTTTCQSITPVKYLFVESSYDNINNSSFITWATAKEWENSHFEVQRAVNTIETWETVGRVEGNGYSDGPIEYSFKDEDLPIAGGNIFYRLKQVDFNETYSYSATKAIQTLGISELSTTWVAYPNPSSQTTGVIITLANPELYQDEKINISISNLLGQSKNTEVSSPEAISPIVSEWLNPT